LIGADLTKTKENKYELSFEHSYSFNVIYSN